MNYKQQEMKTILFSSAQDPRSWDLNAKDVDVVITCLSDADAKKAEMLFNELLVRAETSEAALRKLGYQRKNAMPECKCVFCGKMFPAAEPMNVCLECEASADPRVKDMRVQCRHLEHDLRSLILATNPFLQIEDKAGYSFGQVKDSDIANLRAAHQKAMLNFNQTASK